MEFFMKLKILATGSSGNCYILGNENEKIIIDLGINFDILKKEICFNFKNVLGVLLSHAHS